MMAWQIMAIYILPKRKRDIPVIIMSDRFEYFERESDEEVGT